jgi:hypothetical protein
MVRGSMKLALGIAVAAIALLSFGSSAKAQATIYSYSLNTSSLNPSDTYYLFFELLSGGPDGGNNFVRVSDFNGATLGDISVTSPFSPNPYGNVLTDGGPSTPPTFVYMDDFVTPFNYVAVEVAFIPTSDLSFSLESTNDPSPLPDTFSFAVLDSGGNPLPSTAPDETGSLIELTMGFPADYETYSLVSSTVPLPQSGEMALLLMVPVVGFSAWRKFGTRRSA